MPGVMETKLVQQTREQTRERCDSGVELECREAAQKPAHLPDEPLVVVPEMRKVESEEAEFEDAVEDYQSLGTIERNLWKKVVRQANNIFRIPNYEKNISLQALEDEEGYIPVKTIAEQKGMLQITNDWRVVAQCLATNYSLSRKFEVNSDYSKVRQRIPETTAASVLFFCCFVVLDGFQGASPEELVTEARELCSPFGTVADVMLLDSIPEDMFSVCSNEELLRVQQSLKRHKKFGLPVVRFKTPEYASRAEAGLKRGWRSSVHPYIVHERSEEEDKDSSRSPASSQTASHTASPKPSPKFVRSIEAQSMSPKTPRALRTPRTPRTPRSTLRKVEKPIERPSEARRPWVGVRRKAVEHENVLRQPKGPDGTRGTFRLRR